jgi:hypothetical protein
MDAHDEGFNLGLEMGKSHTAKARNEGFAEGFQEAMKSIAKDPIPE